MTESLVSRSQLVQELPAESLLRLRAVLVADRRAQVLSAVQHEAAARQLAGQTDPDSVLERELAVAAAARAHEAVGDIERALERVHVGTYGTCEGCGGAIPFERLEAIPYARRCVACGTRRDGPVR